MAKTITVTPLLQSQIDRVLRAAELYPNDDDDRSQLEAEQLLLAEEVMKEYARHSGRLETPRPAKAGLTPVVDVALTPKRRRS